MRGSTSRIGSARRRSRCLKHARDLIGLRADIGVGQARALAVLVFPQKRGPVGIAGEVIDDLAEIEMLGHAPLEVAMPRVMAVG